MHIEASYHVWNRSTHHRLNFCWVRQNCLFSLFSERPDSTLSSTFSLPSSLLVSQSLMGGFLRSCIYIISLLLCSLWKVWRGGLRNEEATWWAQRRQIRGMCCRVTGKNLCGCGTVGLLCLDKSSGSGGWCPRWGRYGGGRRLGMNSSI